jgi:hypothetical protein
VRVSPSQARTVAKIVNPTVRTLRAQELELLRFLAPRFEGTSLKQLHEHDPKATEVVDRLVAVGEVTRYPGCLFGVSTTGRLRLESSQ